MLKQIRIQATWINYCYYKESKSLYILQHVHKNKPATNEMFNKRGYGWLTVPMANDFVN